LKDIIVEKFDSSTPMKICLDHGFVTLVDCMPRVIKDEEESADHVIAEAARCSYQRGTKTMADDKTLIRYLMRHNHTSPFEMIEFKFHCKLPIFVARQMVRTRTASLNELSGRYSEMPEEFYMPEHDDMRTQSTTNTQGSEGILDDVESKKMREDIHNISTTAFYLYSKFLEGGLVREQARMVLPLSTYTEWYWKIDLKNLLHFLNLRCDSHAQKEIRVYGDAILDLIKPIVPWTIEAWEEYSPYRGGMILTKKEVKALKNLVKNERGNDQYWGEDIISTGDGSKLENKEWAEKLKRLGF